MQKEIFGYEKEVKELIQLNAMLKNASIYEEKGVRIPRGILISGRPGVGKTKMAKTILAEGVNLVSFSAAECSGEDIEQEITDAFAEARWASPAVLLLDELDKMIGKGSPFLSESSSTVRNILLRELDSISSTDHILVVATCNEEFLIDPALKRSGRFDRHLVIPIPDAETRRELFNRYFEMIDLNLDFNMDSLIAKTYEFSCADIECLVNEIALQAILEGDMVVEDELVDSVLRRKEFKSAAGEMFSNKTVVHNLAVHEAAHALSALILDPSSIHEASIIPQGTANGHIRLGIQEEKTIPASKVFDNLVILLSGHVAERLMLGEYLIGSEDDIEKAKMIAFHLVTEAAVEGYEGITFDDYLSMPPNRKSLDLIIKMLKEADQQAERLLSENRELYEKIVFQLETNHYLTGDVLRALR